MPDRRNYGPPVFTIPIPSEDDFRALQDEALQNNRINGLPAKAPTEITRDGATWTSTTPDGAKAWVDDMVQLLGLMCFAAEIDGWEHENDRRLGILAKYFPDQYERICEKLWSARENVKQLRW